MLFLNVPPQGDVILSVLGYVGVPSLLAALIWVYYNIKRGKEVQDSLMERVATLERKATEHDKLFALENQDIRGSIDGLRKSIDDMPDRIISGLFKQGLLQIKN